MMAAFASKNVEQLPKKLNAGLQLRSDFTMINAKLDEQLDGYEERLKEIKDRRHNPSTLTTEDAFPLSLQYCNFLCFCISVAASNNPVFNGMEGPSTFDTIR